MITMNYQDLQYRYSKSKKKKNNPTEKKVYPRVSASTWKDYSEWLKEQKLKEELQKKAQNRKKKFKCTNTKTKGSNAVYKPANALKSKDEYQQQLQHPLWLKKRGIILNRDQHKCVQCGSEHDLQVHHTRYTKGKKAWEYPNATLVTLCKKCHTNVHSDLGHKLNPYNKNN